MKVFISAAETSSDAHGAKLVQAIRRLLPKGESLEVFGMGGPLLQKENFRAVVDSRSLLSMGFVEIIGILPRVFGALKDLTKAVQNTKPDVAVFIDYPDFHFLLAKRFEKMGIPMIYFIPPKVWAWRKRRIEFLKKYFKKVLCILPFEEKFYQEHGISVRYVGSPLVDQLPLQLTRDQARTRFSLEPQDQVLLLMPGSRKAELKQHLSLSLQAARDATRILKEKKFLERSECLKKLIPFPLTLSFENMRMQVDSEIKSWSKEDQGLLQIQVLRDCSSEAMVAADAGVIKSGTSTLEAAILRCPHVVIYKINPVSNFIFKKWVKYEGPAGLSNLVWDAHSGSTPLVPELLRDQVTLDSVTQAIVALFTDQKLRERMKSGFKEIRDKIICHSNGNSPSENAAQEILEWVANRKSN